MSPFPLCFLALGDSYTIGEGVETDRRWPNQLASRLLTEGIVISAPKIIARTGWTTGDLLNALDERKLSRTFNLVSLLIGVNNQYRGLSLGDYQREFRLLLQYALNYATGDPSHVLVLSIPDWSKTPFAEDRDRMKISRQIAAFNQVNYSETELAGVHYVNIATTTQQVQPNRSLYAADGLHPSGASYSAWVSLIFPLVCEILQINV